MAPDKPYNETIASTIGISPEDYENLPHDSLGPRTLAIQMVLTVLCTIVVFLRIYTRQFVTRTLGIDDWLIAAALVFIWATLALGWLLHYQGFARHIWDITPNGLAIMYKGAYAATIFYFVCLGLIKGSILASYLRLFGSLPVLRKITIWTQAVNVAMTISFVVVYLSKCTPIKHAWEPLPHAEDGRKCIHRLAFTWASSILNILLDFWVWFLPMRTLWMLTLPRSQKLITAFLMSLGGFACIASILRLVEINDSFVASPSKDPTYDTAMFATYSHLEETLGAIAASVPPVKALIRLKYPGFLQGSAQSNSADREATQLRMSQHMASRMGGGSGGGAPSFQNRRTSEDASLSFRESKLEDGFSCSTKSRNNS